MICAILHLVSMTRWRMGNSLEFWTSIGILMIYWSQLAYTTLCLLLTSIGSNQDASMKLGHIFKIKVSGPVSAMEAFCCSKLLPARMVQRMAQLVQPYFFIHHTQSPYDFGQSLLNLEACHVWNQARFDFGRLSLSSSSMIGRAFLPISLKK